MSERLREGELLFQRRSRLIYGSLILGCSEDFACCVGSE